MPYIPSELLTPVCHLYPDAVNAIDGTRFGGSGVFISVGREEDSRVFAVTCSHVAHGKRERNEFPAPHIRTFDYEGQIKDYAFEAKDWKSDPTLGDIACVEVGKLGDGGVPQVIPWDLFLEDEIINEKDIGPGENVILVGRFVDLPSSSSHQTTVRFGHISMMPADIGVPFTDGWEAYILDIHSRSGYSGGPVFCYRSAGQVVVPRKNKAWLMPEDAFVGLLGIHVGQFPMRVSTRELEHGREQPYGVEQIRQLEMSGVSGMSIAVPAAYVRKLIQSCL